MKSKSEKTQKDINVILLKNRVYNNKQEIIEDYVDILKSCKTAQDFYSLLEQLYDEAVILTGEKFVEMQISKNAEILEEMRNEFFSPSR